MTGDSSPAPLRQRSPFPGSCDGRVCPREWLAPELLPRCHCGFRPASTSLSPLGGGLSAIHLEPVLSQRQFTTIPHPPGRFKHGPQGKPRRRWLDPSSLLRPECTRSSELLGAALEAQGRAGSLAPAWPKGLPRTCARRVRTVRVPPSSPYKAKPREG